jgi:superfamily II DNA or RNA helicase
MNADYSTFLERKRRVVNSFGFDVSHSDLNPQLKPFQQFCTAQALKKGKYALFEDCGLGKTFQQLEWANQVVRKTNKPVLILAPLAVSGQTIKEGEKFGIEVNKYYDFPEPSGIVITNYEQLENIDTNEFGGVVIDESSILKNYEGAYRTQIINAFKHTPYKLACTATPSPNDPMELGNHAEFLNIMGRNEMLATYFVHDGGDTSKWRLKGHAEEKFWNWVNSWAIMLSKPSDIGYSDEGYNLPPLNYIERIVSTPMRSDGSLFNNVNVSATNFNEELRLTKSQRLEEVASIVSGSPENFIIWVKHNDEGELLRQMLPGSIEVSGSDPVEYKEEMLLGFAENKFKTLITKAKIAQFGLNYQNCHNQVFASPEWSFETPYQCIRRSYRFGQKHPVNAFMVVTDTMQNVVTAFKKKQLQHERMQQMMTKSMNQLKTV